MLAIRVDLTIWYNAQSGISAERNTVIAHGALKLAVHLISDLGKSRLMEVLYLQKCRV